MKIRTENLHFRRLVPSLPNTARDQDNPRVKQKLLAFSPRQRAQETMTAQSSRRHSPFFTSRSRDGQTSRMLRNGAAGGSVARDSKW